MKKHIRGVIPLSFIFIIIILSTILITPTSAFEEQSFVLPDYPISETLSHTVATGTSTYGVDRIRFAEISYYQKLDRIIFVSHDLTDFSVPDDPSDFVDVDLYIGAQQVGTGRFAYQFSDKQVTIQLFMKTWNVSGFSGYQVVSWSEGDAGLGDVAVYTIVDGSFDALDDNQMAFALPSTFGRDTILNGTYYVQQKIFWYNNYRQMETDYLPTANTYALNVTRDGEYNAGSLWYVYDVDTGTVYLNETGDWKINDTQIYVWNGTTINVECMDRFGIKTWTDTLTWLPTPPPDDGVLNTLSGTIKDAKTNAIIPSNPINLSTATGYGGSYSTTSTGAGAYSITNIIDDIYYIQANRSGYENYTFQKNITSNTEHIIYMVENITLDANKSGVYGTVTNYYNATGVPTTWMKISNDTWYQITYTNQNGYYEFLNFAPGNYTIQAQKTGYFPYEAAITFSSNELKYVPIELVSEEIPPDPTPTPAPPTTNILTPFRAIISSFGISESQGGAFIGIFIIIFMGVLFSRAGTLAAIAGMFFGFISSIFMGLLPSYLLSITIIVVILLILRLRGDL